MREFTEDQKRAIAKNEENFSVLASAGSGKTLVLSERYVRLVRELNYRPSQILTITFTNKAAAEMKRRIVARLRDDTLYDAAQEAETGPIQTIHSFCERILRENAIEAGIDPEFEIMGLSDAASKTRLALEKSLVVSQDVAPDAEYALSQMMGNRSYGSTSSSADLLQHLADIHRHLRNGGVSRTEILNRYSSPRIYLEWTRAALEDQLAKEVVDFSRTLTQMDWVESVTQSYMQLKLKGKPGWLKKNSEATEFNVSRILCGLVQIACEAWRLVDAEMRELQAFDFAALESRAVRLLEQRPALRQRLELLYPIVMVDEAQDVNPMQYRLLTALSPKSMMMVGDDQQSIFGFRDADVELFRSRALQNPVVLTKNHRSTEPILRFVDQVFGSLWSEQYRPMAPPVEIEFDNPVTDSIEGVELWQLNSKGDWFSLAEMVKQLMKEGVSGRDIAILVKDNPSAAGIAQVFRNSSIGVQLVSGPEKFYTRLEVHDLANTLTALLNPADNYALLATLRSPVVNLSLDAIVMLSKEESVWGYLQTFISPISIDQPRLERFLEWFGPLTEIAERLPAYEVLGEVLARSDLFENLARREDFQPRIANVRKLLSIACTQPDLPTSEFALIIREIQELKHKEGEAPFENDWDDLVTVSTIHKSKGLEWQVVILADGMEFKTRPVKILSFDAPKGMYGLVHKGSSLTMHEFLKHNITQKNQQELTRLMYVAATRARTRLCICTYGKSEKGFLKLIHQGLGQAAFDALYTRRPM